MCMWMWMVVGGRLVSDLVDRSIHAGPRRRRRRPPSPPRPKRRRRRQRRPKWPRQPRRRKQRRVSVMMVWDFDGAERGPVHR